MKRFMKTACIFIAALLFISAEHCNGSVLKNLGEGYKRTAELKKPAMFGGNVFLPRGQRLTEAQLRGMTSSNSPFQALEIQEAFQKFDQNGDGHITVEELKDAMEKSGEQESADHAKDMIKDVDRNGNGIVEYAEFEDYMASQIGDPITDEDTENYFNTFDTTGDGFITSNELARAKMMFGDQNYSKKEIDDMIAETDANSDQKVSDEEFAQMVKKKGVSGVKS